MATGTTAGLIGRIAMWRHLGALGAVAMVSMFSLAAHGQDYAIRMERPAKVGDRFKVVATLEAIASMRGADPAKVTGFAKKAQVEADTTITAVSPEGKVTAATYTIHQFKGEVDGRTVVGVPAGTVVHTVRVEGKVCVQPQAAGLSKEITELLSMALPTLHEPGTPGDDEVFGTRDRKKVGDKWPVNAQAMAKGMTQNGFITTKDDVTGSTSVVKFHHVDGVPCLQINGTAKIGKASPPRTPPGFKVVSYGVECTREEDLPGDVSKPLLRESMELKMTMQTEKTSGQTVERLDMSSLVRSHQQYTPLPPAPAGDKVAPSTAPKPAPETRPAGTETQKK